MPDTPSFVVNDRRKFTSVGDLRHDTSTTDSTLTTAGEAREPGAGSPTASDTQAQTGPQLVSAGSGTAIAPAADAAELADATESTAFAASESSISGDADNMAGFDQFSEDPLPPGPTEEQNAEATRAYDATVDRLDTALRAADPGGERIPEMTFERLTQSLYTQALMLLGGATQPGETPRVDILGARQTIDMLAILAEKTRGNLSPDEDKLLQSALFDLRMGFLEITQALARQAASQRQPGGMPGMPPAGVGPRIVR